MIALIAVLLTQTPVYPQNPKRPLQSVFATTVDGGTGIQVTCDNCSSAAGPGGSALEHVAAVIDGGWISATVINFPATQPVSIASMPSTPVTGTFWQATQPVSGTLTCSGPLTDTQLRASVVPVYVQGDGGGVFVTNFPASQPVTGTFWQATQPVSGTFWQATQPVSIASMPSTPVTGTFWQATQPVSGTLTCSGPLTDTQLRATAVPVSLSSTTITGSVATTGPLTDTQLRATPVPVSLTSTTITGTVAATQSGTWSDRLLGNGGAVMDAANNSTAPANVLVTGFQLQSGAAATNGTAGQVGNAVASLDHVLYMRMGGPVLWSCFIPLTTTATTQCRAAPGAGIRAYVTSMACSNGAATVQGVDIVFGTGTNCGTGTTALTHKYQMGTNQLTTSPFLITDDYNTGLVPTAANAICLRPTAATAFGCTLTGFNAP